MGHKVISELSSADRLLMARVVATVNPPLRTGADIPHSAASLQIELLSADGFILAREIVNLNEADVPERRMIALTNAVLNSSEHLIADPTSWEVEADGQSVSAAFTYTSVD